MSSSRSSSSAETDGIMMGLMIGAAHSDHAYKKGIEKGIEAGQQLQYGKMISRLNGAPTFVAAYHAKINELKEVNKSILLQEKEKLATEFGKCDTRFLRKRCQEKSLATARTNLFQRLQYPPSPEIENKDSATLTGFARELGVANFNSLVPELLEMPMPEFQAGGWLKPR
jgi:hypothetical protein